MMENTYSDPNNIPENEQWRLGGNCSFCRRKTYCHADCVVKKRRFKAELQSMASEFIKSRTGLDPNELLK